MRRTRYVLWDPAGSSRRIKEGDDEPEPYEEWRTRGVKARWTQPASEPAQLDPWMTEGINRLGWRLSVEQANEDSGHERHGHADWNEVADQLAAVVRPILDDQVELSEEEYQALLEQAQSALDTYDVAVMEVLAASEDGEEPQPQEEDTDG